MFKASKGHLWALVVALYFLEYGVRQLAADELGAGIIFTAMALVWAALARMQYRRTRPGRTDDNPTNHR